MFWIKEIFWQLLRFGLIYLLTSLFGHSAFFLALVLYLIDIGSTVNSNKMKSLECRIKQIEDRKDELYHLHEHNIERIKNELEYVQEELQKQLDIEEVCKLIRNSRAGIDKRIERLDIGLKKVIQHLKAKS